MRVLRGWLAGEKGGGGGVAAYDKGECPILNKMRKQGGSAGWGEGSPTRSTPNEHFTPA